ncbi:vacuolar protein sorting-associated protein 64 [Diplogelasinospora grovesii]|uniref:Vacuolar protein sorting-associated protein 64 n=1 Tax=Diplogelasinospora grovesii TaxID=303347 RepID=A0AAN6NE02_9PEZI|nr:vacuolar protein sorting-associated protein 64 [Diplogelasinospora grovesii]
MTAVAAPPSFGNLNRTGWIDGGQGLNSTNSDGMNMFASRKTMQRSNSSSSVSSSASNSPTATVSSKASAAANSVSGAGDWANPAPRKTRPSKGQWNSAKADTPSDFTRATPVRSMANGMSGASAMNQPPSFHNTLRSGADGYGSTRQPVLHLLSVNGTFERKTISVPFYPETLRIGRQTNAKTVPTPLNGFFDSKVLSRQHAEIWADASGKIWIRDVKSSNGTFVNGTRLSLENRESEPHELQAQDHLELGIDIVSEDQKTVVHHKVAAKVEHAGFISTTSNLLDLNFSELDSLNSAMMNPLGGLSFRGRSGSQASRMGHGNMGAQANAMGPARQYWLNPVTTDQIVKKLHTELRNARLQESDLVRTGQFINALVKGEDVKNLDKPEASEPAKNPPAVNGNASFKSDGTKARFSEPPAPPPSQPLPEKPDITRPSSSDAPSLKRAPTERPKSTSATTSPISPDGNLSRIIQLTEALNDAKRELHSHSTRMRDLEEMLNKEREARLQAEDLVHKLEESNHSKMNGSAPEPLANGHVEEPSKVPEPPVEQSSTPETDVREEALPVPEAAPEEVYAPDRAEVVAAAYQIQLDKMASEMEGMRQQLDAFRQRAEKAEAERDADRKTLAELVQQIRQRDEQENLDRAAQRRSQSRSKKRASRPCSREGIVLESLPVVNGTAVPMGVQADGPSDDAGPEVPTLSRANTITQPPMGELTAQSLDPAYVQSMPYASMIGVVLLGMGLMAYLNGWQPQPRLLD